MPKSGPGSDKCCLKLSGCDDLASFLSYIACQSGALHCGQVHCH